MHHFLAIIGSVGGIYVGGAIGAISNFILIIEITTPIANVRWLLHLHNLTHLKVYLLCAVGMTVGFLIVRVILMTYIAFYYFVPAVAQRDQFSDTARLYQVVIWLLFTLHLGLLVLNCLWFSKMIIGVSKFLESTKSVPPPDETPGKAQPATRQDDVEGQPLLSGR